MEQDKALRVGHLIPYLGRAQGGPVLNLAECSRAQLEQGLQVSIFSTTRASDGAPAPMDSRVTVVTDASPGWGPLRKCPLLWERAQSTRFDILHSHGLWTDVNRLAADLARRRKIPHVLTPCGMLARGALRHHWWNKVPARIWFQVRALREAACLQAQSRIEVRQIRDFGLRNPVALIPAAVAGRQQDRAISAQEFRSRFRVPGESRVILFLGRLHPVKGLSRLVSAWRQLAPKYSDWLLVLAGPDEGGFEGVLRSQAASAGVADRIVFTGVLNDDQKWGALDAADLFVMPSDFENFGVAIVEALQSGIPVITTTGTPWKELPVQGAGWCVEPTTGALAAALAEALGLPVEKRRAMGRRAAEVAVRFSPEETATDLIEVYTWLLGRGAKPSCVVDD